MLLSLQSSGMRYFSWVLVCAACIMLTPDTKAQSSHLDYPNMQGTTGAVKTPYATTLPVGYGLLSVQESFITDSLDRVHITYGISDRVEVGLRSDIPALKDPKLSLIVKFNVLEQNSLIQGMPAIGLGMNRGQFYLVSTMERKKVAASFGWNKTESIQGFFANTSIELHPNLSFHADISPEGTGAVLRGKWNQFWLSFIFYDPLLKNEPLEDFFWEVGYQWQNDLGPKNR